MLLKENFQFFVHFLYYGVHHGRNEEFLLRRSHFAECLIRCFLLTNCAPQSAIRDSLRDANHTVLFLFCWQLRVCRYSPPRFSVRRGSDEPTTARKSLQAQDCISPAMYWPSTGLSTITGNVITARYGHTATFASKRKTFLR